MWAWRHQAWCSSARTWRSGVVISKTVTRKRWTRRPLQKIQKKHIKITYCNCFHLLKLPFIYSHLMTLNDEYFCIPIFSTNESLLFILNVLSHILITYAVAMLITKPYKTAKWSCNKFCFRLKSENNSPLRILLARKLCSVS